MSLYIMKIPFGEGPNNSGEQREKEPIKIELPQNSENRKILQNQLEEYEQHLKKLEAEIDPNKDPKQRFDLLVSTKYKIAIVKKLLQEGYVDKKQLSLELYEKDGRYDRLTFESAWVMIRYYALTDVTTLKSNGVGRRVLFPDR